MEWVTLIVIAILVIFVLFVLKHRKPNAKTKRTKRARKTRKVSRGPTKIIKELLQNVVGGTPTKPYIERFNEVKAEEIATRNAGQPIAPETLNAYRIVVAEIDGTPVPDTRDDIDDIQEIIQYLNALDAETLLFNEEYTQHITDHSIDERLHNAKLDSANREEAAEKYFDSGITYTNDDQNVHESKIVTGAKLIYDIIRKTPHHPNAINEIIRAANGKPLALDTIRAMQHSGSTHVMPFETSESDILNLVWARSYDPQNTRTRDDIQAAVIDALVDGNGVCPSGRVQRVLYALVLLDYDMRITAPMTYETYKNQIFAESGEILKQCIDEAAQDPQRAAIARSYRGEPGDDPTPQQEAQFQEVVKKRIADNINSYADRLTDRELQGLLAECYAAIEI